MHKEGHLSNRSNLAPIELPITVTTMTLFEPKPNYIFFSIKAFFCWGKTRPSKKVDKSTLSSISCVVYRLAQ